MPHVDTPHTTHYASCGCAEARIATLEGALTDHPDCGKYCVCCQRGVDMSSGDLLAAGKREVAALEALADPLALLEAALGVEEGYVVKGWQDKDGELTIQRIDGKLHYLWEYPDRIGEVSRAEAAALLAEGSGKGEVRGSNV